MQTGNREYLGRNEFWTPSTIGLTQSLIDTSINKIELKDNSSEVFIIENNKLKTTLPIICEEPTENEEVSNKKYIDDKCNDLNSSINSKSTEIYNYCNSNFPLKSQVGNPVQTSSISMNQSTYSITNISKIPTDSYYGFETCNISFDIPSSITNQTKIIQVDFLIRCNLSDKLALGNLYCSVNSNYNSPLDGTFHKGIPIGNDTANSGKYLYKFKFNEIEKTSSNSFYLYFFFDGNQSETNYTFTINTYTARDFQIRVIAI